MDSFKVTLQFFFYNSNNVQYSSFWAPTFRSLIASQYFLGGNFLFCLRQTLASTKSKLLVLSIAVHFNSFVLCVRLECPNRNANGLQMINVKCVACGDEPRGVYSALQYLEYWTLLVAHFT